MLPAIQIIQHRVNDLRTLKSTPTQYGAEVDIRSRGNDLILQHEPCTPGENAEPFIQKFAGDHRLAPLILNVKEDGHESRLIQLCQDSNLENYFFLDVTLPTLVRLVRDGFYRVAVRVSEYEPIELAKKFAGKALWAWVDCFSGKPPSQEKLETLFELGYRVCLVSPELQGFAKDIIEKHAQMKKWLRPEDAVCTKQPKLWESA